MKKRDLKRLALLGIAGGIALSQSAEANETSDYFEIQVSSLLAANDISTKSASNNLDPNAGNLGYHLMDEDELLLELNAEGQKMYNSLDLNNKKLAREVASARCNGSNACKGLNACKTERNSCVGKGDCKGQSICAIADKNLAVRLVYNKMTKK